MTKNFPSFNLYMKIGIEGLDHEVSEVIEVSWDPSISVEANARIMGGQAQVAQLKMQIGMAALMQKLPEFLEKKAIEQGIDLDDLL